MIPPSNAPAAPPMPLVAAHVPIARFSGGPGANEAVMIASVEAAMSAPEKPCSPRATTSTALSGASPPASEVSANRTRPITKIRRCPKWSAARPPSIKKPANVIV